MAHILIIDDHKGFREMVQEVLEGMGHRVSQASDGNAGMKTFRTDPAALVVCDVFMPGKDGISTIRDLRAGFSGVKILAVSGGGGDLVKPEDYLNLARRFGADEVLPKPVGLKTLEEAVARLLND